MKNKELRGITEVYWTERLKEPNKLIWVIFTVLLTTLLHVIWGNSLNEPVNIATGTIGTLYTVVVLYFHRNLSKLPSKWQVFLYNLCWSVPLAFLLLFFLVYATSVIFIVASVLGLLNEGFFIDMFGEEYGEIIGFFTFLILASVVFIRKSIYEFNFKLLFRTVFQGLRLFFLPKKESEGGAYFIAFELSIIIITLIVEHLIYLLVNKVSVFLSPWL